MSAGDWFLADDLSGALEVGAAWRSVGHPVSVAGPEWDGQSFGAIMGLSSETRNESPAEARVSVSRILDRMAGRRLAFKKIDSTMRGPIGAELSVMLERFPDRPLLFTPANPAVGRQVKQGGRLFVDGRAVTETAFATDPVAPVRFDRLDRLILESGGPETVSLKAEDLQGPEAGVAERLAGLWARRRIVTVEASIDADLDRAITAAWATGLDFLPIGSGALASSLERAGCLSSGRSVAADMGRAYAKRLFVIGSAHPWSREQLERAVRESGLEVVYLPENLDSLENAAVLASVLESLAVSFRRGDVAALASQLPEDRATLPPGAAECIVKAMGRLAIRAVDEFGIDFAFFTGGEIAQSAMRCGGCVVLELEGELEPGVSLATMKRGRAESLQVVVKPGGFGALSLIERLCGLPLR